MTRRIAATKIRRRRVKFNTGTWTEVEKKLFLLGLQKFGKGKWKEIATTLTTRSAVQIKSHGQKLLYRAERGEDIFLGVCDSRAMECASDDEISSTQQVSESEDEFTGSRAHSMTNNQEGKELCDFEAELATPKSFQNSTILYHVVMDKAPIKKPLGRLSLAKAFVHIQSRSRSPIAVLFNDSWPDTGSQNLDIMAATALLSLSSFSCVDQSPPDMSSRFSDFYHATKRVSNPHGDCEQIHKL